MFVFGRLAYRVACGKVSGNTWRVLLRKGQLHRMMRFAGLSLTSFVDPDKVLSLALR